MVVGVGVCVCGSDGERVGVLCGWSTTARGLRDRREKRKSSVRLSSLTTYII